MEGDGAKNAIQHWQKPSNVKGHIDNATNAITANQAAMNDVNAADDFLREHRKTKCRQKNFEDADGSGDVDISFSDENTTDEVSMAVWDNAWNGMRSFYDLNPHIHGEQSNRDWLLKNGVDEQFLG